MNEVEEATAQTPGNTDKVVRLHMEDRRRQHEQTEQLMRLLETSHVGEQPRASAELELRETSREDVKIARLTDEDDRVVPDNL